MAFSHPPLHFSMCREGLKNTYFYPHFVEKGGGSVHVDILFLFYNIIIKCQNGYKGKMGGGEGVRKCG